MAEEQDKNVARETRFPGNAYTNIKPKGEAPQQSTDIPKPDEKKKPKIKPTKKTVGERIAENFLAADREDIKEHLLFDWLIPEIKSAIEDIIHMVLYGTRGGSRGSRNRSGGGRYTPYNSIYDERKRERERGGDLDPTRQNFRRIRLTFYAREDAEEVLGDLRDSLEESSGGFVTVKELYSLAELPTNSTMYKWGWFDLRDARILREGEDYTLEMPRAEVIR